jgi:hypothetical protein
MLSEYDPDVLGVNANQAVPCGGEPHEGAGSPASVVAPVMSVVAENGTVITGVAFAKSSFAGGGTTVTWKSSGPFVEKTGLAWKR